MASPLLRWTFLFLSLLLLGAGLVHMDRAGQAWLEHPHFGKDIILVESDNGRHVFEVEVATSHQARAQGLMFRQSLADNAGMLFLFEEPSIQKFWMRNTLIPLDMIFIAPSGRILRIAANATPESEELISSGAPALGVLEIPGGRAAELGLKAGDRVAHDYFGG
jgi:uncharacterized membrane protein (UPF0127 family)